MVDIKSKMAHDATIIFTIMATIIKKKIDEIEPLFVHTFVPYIKLHTKCKCSDVIYIISVVRARAQLHDTVIGRG